VKRRSHRHTQSGDPGQSSQRRMTSRTGERLTLARALGDSPDDDEGSRQRASRDRRTPNRGQQNTETPGASSRPVRRTVFDTRRSARASEQRGLQLADTRLPQRNPHAFPPDAAAHHAGTCPVAEDPGGPDNHADGAKPQHHFEDRRLAAHVAMVVDSAPPLTDTQRHRLAAIFHSV